MERNKYKIRAVLLFVCMLLFTACAEKKEVDVSRVMDIFYVSNSETKLEVYEYEMQSNGLENNVEELIAQLSATPAKLEYKAPLAFDFSVLKYEIEDGRLHIDVGEQYKTLKPTTEVLIRAALVRTFCQLQGISYVAISVAGEQLHDNLGNVVGLMNADQFIDNAGSEINAYEIVKLKLYFANEEGNALVATNRNIRYNTNIPMEKLIMENIIAGPNSEELPVFPTVNPDVKIVSITVKDGICYVNLNEAFLTQIYNVTSEVAIYSLVNSLIELPGINKVQISVNGDTDMTYRESFKLSTVFERNLDIITTINSY